MNDIASLLSGASHTPNQEARAVYLARARALLEAERERLQALANLLDEAEAELARLASTKEAAK